MTVAENLGIAKGYIQLDLSQLTQSAAEAVDKLNSIEKAGQTAQSQLDLMKNSAANSGNAFEKAAQKAKSLQTELNTSKEKASFYKGEMDKLNTVLDSNGKKQQELAQKLKTTKEAYTDSANKTKDLKDKYDEAKKSAKSLADEFGKNSEQAQKAAKEEAELGKQYKASKKETDSYLQTITTLETQHEACNEVIDKTKTKLADCNTQYETAQTSVTKLTGELAAAQSKMAAFGDQMGVVGDKIKDIGEGAASIGTKLTAGVTAPLIALGTGLVKSAMTAEDSYAKVQTIMDDTVMSYDTLTSAVRESSDELNVSVSDFNEALYQTISATNDTANAVEYTAIAAKAAKGGFTDTATAVDGLTTIMNAYGLVGGDAMQHVADVMLTTQNYGKTTFGELAQYIGQVVPVAASAGMSIEELFADMAVMTRNGIQTRKAVTALKAALSNIISPSNEASEAAAALGIDFSAAALESKGLSGVLLDVKNSFASAAPEYYQLLQTYDSVNQQMEALEENGQKNTDEYKKLKQASKQYESQLSVLAEAQDSNLAVYAQLFGSIEALNGMMVLTSDKGMEQFDEGLNKIANSAGATEKAFSTMESTSGAKLDKMLNRIKNRGMEMGEKLLPVVEKVVDAVGDLVDKYDKLSDSEKDQILRIAGIAAAAGPLLTIGGKVTSGIGSIVSGVGKLISKKAATTAAAKAIGSAVGDIGVASGTAGAELSGLGGVMTAAISPAGWAIIGAGALAAVGTAIYFINESIIKSDIEKRFGDIALSAAEVEEIAKRLTTRDWTLSLDAYMTAKTDLEGIEQSFNDSIEELNKLNWKVSVGMTLTESEIETYQQSVQSAIQSTQEMLSQQQYTASLGIGVAYNGAQKQEQLNNLAELYSMFSDEFTSIGEEWSNLVNDALADGILSTNEMQELMKKQAELQEFVDKISQNRYEATVDNIVAKFDFTSLDKESFEALQESLQEQLQTRIDEMDEVEIETRALLKTELQEGVISQEEYDEAVRQLEDNIKSKIGSLNLDILDIEIGAIRARYELDDSDVEEFANELTSTWSNEFNKYTEGKIDLQTFWGNMNRTFADGYSELDATSKAGIRKLMDAMEPDYLALQNLQKEYVEAGKMPPAAVNDGLADYWQLEMMTGNVSNMFNLLAYQIINDPEMTNALKAAKQDGMEIPSKLAEALESQFGIVFDEAGNMILQLEEGADWQYDTVEKAFKSIGTSLPQNLIDNLSKKSPQARQTVLTLMNAILNGEQQKEPSLRTLFRNLGINIPEELIKQLAGKNASVQAQAISLLTQLTTAEGTKRQEILEKFRALGLELPDELADAIAEGTSDNSGANAESGRQAAQDYKEGAESELDGVTVGEVEVDFPSGEGPASDYIDDAQAYMDKHTIYATVATNNAEDEGDAWAKKFKKTIQSYTYSITVSTSTANKNIHAVYAQGGFVTSRTFAEVGEAGPEVIIPLGAGYRSRALELFDKTAQILNRDTYNSFSNISVEQRLEQTASSQIDYDRLINGLADIIMKHPIEIENNFSVEQGDVIMEGEKVGRTVAPVISRLQARR